MMDFRKVVDVTAAAHSRGTSLRFTKGGEFHV